MTTEDDLPPQLDALVDGAVEVGPFDGRGQLLATARDDHEGDDAEVLRAFFTENETVLLDAVAHLYTTADRMSVDRAAELAGRHPTEMRELLRERGVALRTGAAHVPRESDEG